MTATDDTFTPDWPHGHELVDANGAAHHFTVRAWDWPGEFPIVGHYGGYGAVWRFTADGLREVEFGTNYRLRNAPAPKPTPREWWVNVYKYDRWSPHETRELADKWAIDDRLECVHVREVIEPEGGA